MFAVWIVCAGILFVSFAAGAFYEGHEHCNK
jgi:hypothetical protein